MSWLPTDLSAGLELWLDASDEDTLTKVGSEVTQWDDKSGNDNHFTEADAAEQPSWDDFTLNGLTVLDFDGGDKLTATNPISHSVFNAFIVKKSTDTPVIDFSPNGGAYSPVHQDGSGLAESLNYGSPTYYKDGDVVTVTTRNEAYDVYHTGNYHICEHIGADTTAHANWSSTFVLGFNNAAYLLDGQIAEIVIVSGTLSTSDRQKIEGYLAHKWGLTANLDAGHPYKSSAPSSGTAVGLAAETNTALSITHSKAVQVGLVSEVNTAFALTHSKAVRLGLAAEVNSALAVTRVGGASTAFNLQADSITLASLLAATVTIN